MIAVTLSVLCESPDQVATVVETLGRPAAGIALEGRSVNLGIVTVDDVEDTP